MPNWQFCRHLTSHPSITTLLPVQVLLADTFNLSWISGRNNHQNSGILWVFFSLPPITSWSFFSPSINSSSGRLQAEETLAWRGKFGKARSPWKQDDTSSLLEALTLPGISYFLLTLRCQCTCSTIIAPRSLKISLRSEIDCTIWRISRSRSSTINVFCSTNASWSSVKPCWNKRFRCWTNTNSVKTLGIIISIISFHNTTVLLEFP